MVESQSPVGLHPTTARANGVLQRKDLQENRVPGYRAWSRANSMRIPCVLGSNTVPRTPGGSGPEDVFSVRFGRQPPRPWHRCRQEKGSQAWLPSMVDRLWSGRPDLNRRPPEPHSDSRKGGYSLPPFCIALYFAHCQQSSIPEIGVRVTYEPVEKPVLGIGTCLSGLVFGSLLP